ncbi:PepSY domain-containing protein [Enterococcus rotai]|uniref:PepSY domain-containing protein n=1 Tax=Enterococcus rotai TaxID=118060 RepID=UPI0035C6F1B6
MNKKMMVVGTLCLGLTLAGCTNTDKSLETNKESKMSTQVSQSTTQDVSGTSNSTTKKTSQRKVSVEDAIKAYNEAYPNTSITSLDLDPSFGIYYYEVKGVDDSKEYEVKINAETGELKKEREETLDQDEQNGVEKKNEALELKDILSIEDVSKIAEDSVGEGTANEWSLERDLSLTYWEVKVQTSNKEITVKINAQTGDILEKELDD